MLFLIREMGDNIKEDCKLCTIKMKVRDNVQSQNTEVKLTKISSSDGKKDIEISDVFTNIYVTGNVENTGIKVWPGAIVAGGGILLSIIIIVMVFRKK